MENGDETINCREVRGVFLHKASYDFIENTGSDSA